MAAIHLRTRKPFIYYYEEEAYRKMQVMAFWATRHWAAIEHEKYLCNG